MVAAVPDPVVESIYFCSGQGREKEEAEKDLKQGDRVRQILEWN